VAEAVLRCIDERIDEGAMPSAMGTLAGQLGGEAHALVDVVVGLAG
jgi:hypothetical protein